MQRDPTLEDYLGSRHSAIGLSLAFFGLPTFLMGIVFALSAPTEFPLWISVSMAAWGAMALPLGVSMRRKRPAWPLWVLANALWAIALLTLFGVAFLGR